MKMVMAQQHGAYTPESYAVMIVRQFDLGEFPVLESPYSDYLKSVLIYSPQTGGVTMNDYAQMLLHKSKQNKNEQPAIEEIVETKQDSFAKKKCLDFVSALMPDKPTRVL